MSRTNEVERKRGTRFGFWFFRTAMKTFGLRGTYGPLYFVGLYYVLFDRAVVGASLAYVRRRFPEHGPVRRLLDVYLLFVNQGKSLLDRYYLLSGGTGIDIELVGFEGMRDLLADHAKGLILLTAHVGNWQIAMTALRRFGRTVHVMMRSEDNAAVKEALEINSEQTGARILYSDTVLGGVVEALKAVDKGEIVSIMGDRTYEYDSIAAPLLGGNVNFPYGAFSLAAAAQCPVAVLLTAKIGSNKYRVDISQVIDPPKGARDKKREEIAACVRQFAGILEEYAHQHPYQWFVFRDMWQSNK